MNVFYAVMLGFVAILYMWPAHACIDFYCIANNESDKNLQFIMANNLSVGYLVNNGVCTAVPHGRSNSISVLCDWDKLTKVKK